MAEVLVIGKKISEMGLVSEITGEEKIPTGATGDKAVTTGQLLEYVNSNSDGKWGRIGGDLNDQIDLQNQFAQERDNLKNYTQEQISQQQEVIQNQIDTTNQGLNYILENGAALPYDESIEYAEGAPVLKDGVNSVGFGSSVVTSDFVGSGSLPDYTPSALIPDTESSYETALGNLRYYSGNFSYLSIPLAVNAGDLYSLTILMSTDSGLTSSNIQVWDQNISAIVNEVGGISSGTTMGKLALVTYTFKATVSATSLRVRMYNASMSGLRKLFGACAKNYGAYTAGELYNIYVSMPPLTRVYPSQNLNYSVTASPTLNLTANTDITTTVNDARFKVGDSIIVSIIQSPSLITRASALVKSAGVATVVLTPNATSSGAVIGLKLKVVDN